MLGLPGPKRPKERPGSAPQETKPTSSSGPAHSKQARHPLRRRYPLSEDEEPEPAHPPPVRSGAARHDLCGGAVPYTCSEENEGGGTTRA